MVAADDGQENLKILWQSYRDALEGRVPAPVLRAKDAPFPQFYPTHAFNPLNDPRRDELLERLLWQIAGDAVVSGPSGIVFTGTWAEHAKVRQSLSAPGLIRLARDLAWGSDSDRVTVHQAAFTDDDPLLAWFAALDLAYQLRGRVELDRFPDELLPVFAASRERWVPVFITQAVVLAVPPTAVVGTIQQATRGLQQDAPLSILLESALLHPDPTVRRATMEGMLERLPAGLLPRLHRPLHKDWLPAEKEWFFAALADRLRVESRSGEVPRTIRLVNEALFTFRDLAEGGAAQSRLSELCGFLFCDERHGEEFRTLGPGAILGAHELIRDSRPEVRRAACAMLAEYLRPDQRDLLRPLAGDPFTADLAVPALSP